MRSGGLKLSLALAFSFLLSDTAVNAGSDNSLPAFSRDEVARAWAPSFYQDFSEEFTDPDTGFNPVDHPLSLFFDGNEDLRDNALHAFRLTQGQIVEALREIPVYYSVIETRTHFYLNYFTYHAVDMNPGGHAHDTENVWLIVKKTKNPVGELVMVVTNAHGYPMFYSPNAKRTWRWESQLSFGLPAKVLPFLDRYSGEHRKGPVHFVENQWSAKSLKLFVSTKSHAIYKLNEEAWRSGPSSGAVYVEESCESCFTEALQDNAPAPVYRYKLSRWEKKFFRSLKSSSVDQIFDHGSKQAGFPRYLVAGIGEARARVNLFIWTGFKTPFFLSDPARMHAFFEANSEGIDMDYLYNPYLREKRPRFYQLTSK